MVAAVTRELSISYGGFIVGGSTDRLIQDKIRIERNYTGTNVTFNVILTNFVTEAAFAAACVAFEAAFRTPRGRLTINQGAAVLLDLNPTPGGSGNTGYNANPMCSKVAGPADTGRSREYEVSIAIETPADLTGQSGRRESTVEIRFTPSRRADVFIQGTYTALTANDAEDQYLASIDAFAMAVITGLGGTIGTDYELVEERYSFDDTDKNLQFSRIYEEIISNQSAALLDDPEIVRLQMSASLNRTGPGDTLLIGAGTPSRLVRVIMSVDANIDATLTLDLKSVWENKLRPHAIALGKQAGDVSVAAVVDTQPTFDFKENKISATLTIVGVTGSGVIEARLSAEINDSSGIIMIPVWDGQLFSRHLFKGPGARVRTLTSIKRTVTGGSGQSPISAKIAQANKANAAGASFADLTQGIVGLSGANPELITGMEQLVAATDNSTGFKPIVRTLVKSPLILGIADTGEQFEVIEESLVEVDVFMQTPTGGGAAGGGSVAIQPGFGVS